MAVITAATGDGLARLIGKNGAWQAELLMPGSGIQCLAADPADHSTLYAGSDRHGAWKISGGHWQQLDLPEHGIFSMAVSPADGAVYAGTEPSRLFVSHDGGARWQELTALQEIPSRPTWSFPPRPWTSHVRWIAPSPHDAARLLVGIELGGLMLTADGGRSFEDHRPGAQPDVHSVIWHPTAAGRAYEAGGGGSAWSKNNGETWIPADSGRRVHYTWAVAADPNDPDCWFLSASPGPREAHGDRESARAHLYRWRGEGPWQILTGGLPDPLPTMPYALAFGGDRLYAGLSDGQLFVSADQGENWERQTIHGDPITCIRAMAVSEDSL